MLATATTLGACAAAGTPREYRFASNRDPAAAVQCASNRLRVEGFEVISAADSAASPPTPDSSAAAVAAPAPGDTVARRDSLAVPGDPPPSVTVTTLPAGTSVAFRRNESTTEVGATEWWRVEVTTTRDDVGTTIVQSTAGVSARRDGPYREPTVPLQSVVGRISASCTW